MGWTRIPKVVSPAEVTVMAERIWAFYAKRGVMQFDPTSWPAGLSSKNQGLRQSGVFNRFANTVTTALIDQLLGAGSWSESEGWGPVLITWPQSGPWQLPHKNWHVDLPVRGYPDRPAAARLFGYISQVGPAGGGTLIVEGSHELARRLITTSPGHDLGQSSDLRRILDRRHPWFRALNRPGGDRLQQFMIDGEEIDGVTVRVIELTGEPGDVVAMMPWTMHNFSMNIAAQPRFMVTHTVMRHDQAFYPAIPHSAKRGPSPVIS